MTNAKKGILSPAGEWWDHLRWMKRAFWHRERTAVRQDVEERRMEDVDYSEDDPRVELAVEIMS